MNKAWCAGEEYSYVVLTSSTLHAPKQQKGNFSSWTTFKWAEFNDISAALQSLSVGIHPLSPQLPYGMLTQHLAPSDQQLHPLKEKTQPVCNLHLCQHCHILTGIFIYKASITPRHHSADPTNSKINGLIALVVENFGRYNGER